MWLEKVLILFLCVCSAYSGYGSELDISLTLGRPFEASSTCGALGPEEFFGPFPGTASDTLICDSLDPANSHPPRLLTDSDDQTFWLSENAVEQVSLTFDFEGFSVLYGVRVQFVSPLPLSVVLEASQDFGSSYHALRYYAEDCVSDFGLPDVSPSGGVGVEELICTSQFSDGVEGQLTYDPLTETGSDPMDFLSTLSLTNLRLRLERPGPAPSEDGGGALLSPFPLDVPSRYYAISDIFVTGACICSGALVSPELQVNNTASCPCDPPLSPPFSCDPPTYGPLCRSCVPGYFLSDNNNECQPCDCNEGGTIDNSTCDAVSGQCQCRPGVEGRGCDSCPEGYLGPSRFTSAACIRCFCNGFASGGCEVEEGWYQARVQNEFEEEGEVDGFTSPGGVSYSQGFLEVQSDPNSQMLTLSFPASYLGDKRTAFSQALVLNLSLPNLPEEVRSSTPSSSSQLKAYVEVTSTVSMVDPPLVLLFELELDVSSTEPQTIEVLFTVGHCTVFRVPYFQSRRPARERDIRIALANIRFLRLTLEFPREVDPSQRTLRLYSSYLHFATDNLTSDTTLLPLQNVSYVERCSCPKSRTGRLCESCSDHYVVDPYFGGEFAHCVSCFCNFRSTSCDPMSGECFNCTGNTEGERCEVCEEGFDRVFPVTLFPCDVCAQGYFQGNESCLPCSCDPEGSLSAICDTTTGVCSCRRGVVGDKCNMCPVNSTGIFPNCEECDECADQWQERITNLRIQVSETTSVISNLNLTNQMQDIDIPDLDQLLQLVRDIEAILRNSDVDVLSTDVQSTHNLICELINTTQELLERAEILQEQLRRSENSSATILSDLAIITAILSELESELANISASFDLIDVPNDSTQLSQQARSALERADLAEELITTNFTSTLQEIQSAIDDFELLNASDVEERNRILLSRVVDFQLRVNELRTLLDEASVQLCGASPDNTTCGECGGVGCDICGAGDNNCEGLVVQAMEALNTSQVALDIANSLLIDIQARLNLLQSLLVRVQSITGEVQRFEGEAVGIRRSSDDVLFELRRLIAELEVELNVTRVDAEEIGNNVNVTLSLQLDLFVEEFFEILLEINSTIEMFFPSNSSEVDLTRRVNEALNRAQRARVLADEVVVNSTILQDRLDELIQQLNASTSVADMAESLLDGASDSLDDSELLLDESEGVLNTSRSRLQVLGERLSRLEVQIEQNEFQLQVARNLTASAVELADQAELEGNATESEFSVLAAEVLTRLRQSEEDLVNATLVRNRTCELQETTQEQLLQVENLIRIEQALIVEQEEIRDDIERVANQIEVLDDAIRVHISRNTACLDTGVLGKRRKRRRRNL